jgi:N-methylhydantoinase A
MTSPQYTYVLAADVGGTFTDVVLARSDGHQYRVKTLSTPPDFGNAIISALSDLVRDHGITPTRIVRTVHGSTVATNAILESKGAPAALVTTRGFRDVLELGRQRRPSLFNLRWVKPTPLVPRDLRFEIFERTASDGTIQAPVDTNDVLDVASRIKESRVEAVAVCLLNSYVNATNEKLVCQTLSEQLPGVVVTGSFEIISELGEYERTSTTVVNAIIRPVAEHYLSGLEERLRGLRVRGELQIMQSNGALMDRGAACTSPVRMVESGPAAGVTAVCWLAKTLALPNVIAFDMGGTTAKATLVESGAAVEAAEYEVGAEMNTNRLLVKGGGYTLRIPSVDISEVGAGGGSIVWLDAGGIPHVGPESAGAKPGPICYGAGGTRPTVTDANLILGYLDEKELAGGSQPIGKDQAVEEFDRQIAQPLGLGLMQAAYGVHRIANMSMSSAIAAVSIERGKDPRDFVLVAFGGAGPMHAALLAKEHGIRTVIVPVSAGLFSAIGLLMANLRYDYSSSFPSPGKRDPGLARQLFSDMTQRALEELTAAGYDPSDISFSRFVDQRYKGQSFDLRVPMPEAIDAAALSNAETAFHRQHLQFYGNKSESNVVHLTGLRLHAHIHTSKLPDAAPDPERREEFAHPVIRKAYFGPESGVLPTPILRRAAIPANPLPGPVIIQDMDTTCVVPPGSSVHRDERANLIISV